MVQALVILWPLCVYTALVGWMPVSRHHVEPGLVWHICKNLSATFCCIFFCVLPEHPAAGEHGAFERWVGRVSEGAAETKGGGGWGARQGYRTSQHAVQRNEEGLDQAFTPLINRCLWGCEWSNTSALITWTLVFVMGMDVWFAHAQTKLLGLIDVLGGWQKKVLLLQKTHKYESVINNVAFSQAIKLTKFCH